MCLPVAAFLLSQEFVITRKEAIKFSDAYWAQAEFEKGDLLLDPREIQKWFRKITKSKREPKSGVKKRTIPVKPLAELKGLPSDEWRVLPVVMEDSINWYDVAGYPLANSEISAELSELSIKKGEYILHTSRNEVTVFLQ